MRGLVVSGGTIEERFLRHVIEQGSFDMLLAADSGMEGLHRIGILPDVIVGDFDSVNSETLSYYRKQKSVTICQLIPEKDDTDTEFAIREAIRRGADDITIVGGTGTRLDHVLGNVWLLGIGLEEGVSLQLLDEHNRIRLIDSPMILSREEQYGTYISLIPFSGEVRGVTLRGLKYPLNDYTLGGFCSLGISNEIVAEEAYIGFTAGLLLVIESKD